MLERRIFLRGAAATVAGSAFTIPAILQSRADAIVLPSEPDRKNIIETIGSISALRANALTSHIVFVAGYYTSGDGGEGFFQYNSFDVISEDNGGTIIIDGAGHRYYRMTSDQRYSVKWFGAKGDGITDDTSAWTNTLRYLNSVGGGTLHGPSGRYQFKQQTPAFGISNPTLLVYDNTTIELDDNCYLLSEVGPAGGWGLQLSTSC